MKRHLIAASAILALAATTPMMLASPSTKPAFPTPSLVPKSWELTIETKLPRRIVVQVPGEKQPTAYWYVTYTITNTTQDVRDWMPRFEMLDREGGVQRSDQKIHSSVFDAIKQRENNDELLPAHKVAGKLNPGKAAAREGVAIFREPMLDMGRFSIFVAGTSGEYAFVTDDKGERLKGSDGRPVVLWKSLHLRFHVRGDQVFPGDEEINVLPSEWVMR